MSAGLYQDHYVIERFLASVSATTIAQRAVVPFDADVLGMVLWLGTAAGGTSGVNVNVSDLATTQQNVTGAANTGPAAYNLWTAANVPTITGTATTNLKQVNTTLVQNSPYALNYPLPGPTGTQGYVTAQSNVLTTQSPVTAPPSIIKPTLTPLFGSAAPDNTFVSLNGFTDPASTVHAGDVLSFVITAGGSGVSLGSAANLNIQLVCSKR